MSFANIRGAAGEFFRAGKKLGGASLKKSKSVGRLARMKGRKAAKKYPKSAMGLGAAAIGGAGYAAGSRKKRSSY